ncbi:response regulator [Pedobacter sp. AW1-32]|uniref:response regulator n=1 Tax=Pedobacter sp. AW1-32 TaxID=3383026 RepID=UPI003FEF37E5
MRKKILIIDDDDELQQIFPLMFEHRDFELRSVLDIDNLEQVINDFKPDLILLDIWIGPVDGRVVCNFIKSHQPTADIPILLISAVEIDIDGVNCMPDAILQKPFNVSELLSLMDDLLNQANA